MLVVRLLTLFLLPVALAQFNFPSSTPSTAFNYLGLATYVDPNVKVIGLNSPNSIGAIYHSTKQFVAQDFRIEFSINIRIGPPVFALADGLALVIQNYEEDALGDDGGFLGYNFPNNIALEVDTYRNNDFGDYSIFSIHYGDSPASDNSPSESYSIGTSPSGAIYSVADSTIRMDYDHDLGVFAVYLSTANSGAPVLYSQTNRYINSMLNLDAGTAWIGIISTGGGWSAEVNVRSFSFSPMNIDLRPYVIVICPTDLVVVANRDTCTYTGSSGVPRMITVLTDESPTYRKSLKAPYSIGTNTVQYISYIDDRAVGSCSQTVKVNPPADGICDG